MSVYIVCCWASVYRQCLVYVTFKCYHYLSALLFCCCCCCYSLIFINISKAALVKCFISFRFASFHFALFMFMFDLLLLLLLFFFIQICNGFFLLLIIGVCSKIYLRFSPSFLSRFFILFLFFFFTFSIFAFFLLGFSFTLIYVFCFVFFFFFYSYELRSDYAAISIAIIATYLCLYILPVYMYVYRYTYLYIYIYGVYTCIYAPINTYIRIFILKLNSFPPSSPFVFLVYLVFVFVYIKKLLSF